MAKSTRDSGDEDFEWVADIPPGTPIPPSGSLPPEVQAVDALAFGGRLVDGRVVPGAANVAIARFVGALEQRLVLAEPEPGEVLALLQPNRPVFRIPDEANRRRRLSGQQLDEFSQWLETTPGATESGIVIVGSPSVGAKQYKGLPWATRQKLQLCQRANVQRIAVVGQSQHLREYAHLLLHREYRRGGVRVWWSSLLDADESELAVWDAKSDQQWTQGPEQWAKRSRFVPAILKIEFSLDVAMQHFGERAQSMGIGRGLDTSGR